MILIFCLQCDCHLHPQHSQADYWQPAFSPFHCHGKHGWMDQVHQRSAFFHSAFFYTNVEWIWRLFTVCRKTLNFATNIFWQKLRNWSENTLGMILILLITFFVNKIICAFELRFCRKMFVSNFSVFLHRVERCQCHFTPCSKTLSQWVEKRRVVVNLTHSAQVCIVHQFMST